MRCSTGTSPLDNKDYNIASPPLYFVRSGHISLLFNHHGFITIGLIGGLLSSYGTNETNRSYGLYYNDKITRGIYAYERQYAFPVRCLVL